MSWRDHFGMRGALLPRGAAGVSFFDGGSAPRAAAPGSGEWVRRP